MAARFLTFALLLAVLAPASGAGDERLVVIVHPGRREALAVEDVAQIYLRRMRFWSDGAPMVPLNLPTGTPLRSRFSRLVLRRSETRLASYWNRQYFEGVLPPATLASVEAVRRYVASDPNAVGYVPASAVDGSVQALLSLE